MKTTPLGPFLGLNNRLPDTELSIRTRQISGNYLSVATDVDIDNAGNLRSRRATKLIHALPGAHSLYMTSDTTGYVMQDLTIYPLTITGEVVSLGALLKVLSTTQPLSWCAVGDDLYYSNGTDSGRITAGLWYPLGLPTPSTPALPTSIGGALLPGTYQISVSYGNETTGEEGGVSASCNPERTTTGGFRLTLPGAVPGATHVHVYLSECNGEVPLYLATLPAITATYDVIALATGRDAPGRYEEPLPAGTLFYSNGRLCSFSGTAVYVGLPHRPGYYLPAEGYIPLHRPVTLVVENQGGTYLCTESQTFFVPGDLGDVQGALSNPVPYGAVPGTSFEHPTKPLVGWFSSHGVVLADTGGQVSALTEEAVDAVIPASGTSAVFEGDGYRRVVSCGYCVNLENNAATRYADFDFTSVSGLYGTKPDGIYLLITDGLVAGTMSFGKLDFGSEELKHLPAVYAGVASDDPLTLTVAYVDERDVEQAYDFATRGSSANMQQQRFDTAKGMRANWFELTLSTTSAFKLANLSFAPTASTRRI